MPTPPDPTASAADDAAALAHDLKAPLRVIAGFAQVLKEDHATQLDAFGLGHVQRIEAAAQRMGAMLDQWLALSRLSLQALEPGPVNLSAMAHDILGELQAQEPERACALHIQDGIEVQADAQMMRRVMDNLLGNAWKYSRTQAHTTVTLRAERQPEGRVAVEVIDQGVGFDMQLVSALFQPFQRLHSASDFPGHGVGLAAVKRMVERHGGRVWARGAPGQGATFGFNLPQ